MDTLHFQDILLRPTRTEDVTWVVETEQQQENAVFIDQWSWQEHAGAIADSNIAHFIIERHAQEETPVRLGYVILTGIDDKNDAVHFRRIVVIAKGEGIGHIATRLIKDYVFERLGAHRLWLNVLEGNVRAHQLYTNEGFVEEGIAREATKLGPNEYGSFRVMSILAHEYSNKQQ